MAVHKERPIAIKDYAPQENRPSRKFLDAVKKIVDGSEVVLKVHPIDYFTPNNQFKVFKKTFTEIESLAHKAELNRLEYVRDSKLYEDYQEERAQARDIRRALKDFTSGNTTREMQAEAIRLGNELQNLGGEAQAANQAAVNKVKQVSDETLKQTNDIFRKLNDAKASDRGLLEEAVTILNQLLEQADQLRCCGPVAKKQQALKKAIVRQQQIVHELMQSVNRNLPQIATTPIAPIAEAPQSNQAYEQLKKRYNEARAIARSCTDNRAAIIREKRKNLQAANADVTKAARALNAAALKHYADVDTQVMHGLIRLYASFSTYKTLFDTAVIKNVSNKEEPAAYRKELAKQQKALDKLMLKLRCEKFGGQTARQIYDKLSPDQLSNLLKKTPDATALSTVLGTSKVSTAGIFKPVNPITAEKRANLKKQPGMRGISVG